ncbi:MAG: protein kinase, partial [Trueperaceae bacterium]
HGAQGVQHYLSLEFVDGRSLESYVEARELDRDLIIDVMKRVAEALQAIHQAGIIHRDIKPGNIMITKGGLQEGRPRVADDAVKLMDFGIAGGKVMTRLTMTGARVGTPVYMSPEQARGLKIDHRSDIYSLGLVLYEMLTGQTAFKGGYEAIVHQQIFQTPAPPRQTDVTIPKALDTLVMRMIAKDPEERPALREVIEVLNDEASWDAADGPELPTRLVVAVSVRQGLIRMLDTEGTLHGSVGEVGPTAFPAAPLAIAVSDDDFLYAAVFEYRIGEDDDHRMIHKLTEDGHEVSRFGRYGMGEGEFLYPAGLACAPGADGDVYVLDGESLKVQRYAPDGTPRGSFGGRGGGQGTFDDPRALTVGPDGKLYVLDHGNRQIQRFSADGTYETRWAFRMGQDQPGMRVLDGMALGPDGTLYVSDATAGRIRTITPAGRVGQSYRIEPLQGEATEAMLDLGVDHEGNLYAARRGGHLIRKFAPDGSLAATLEAYAPLVQTIVQIRPGATEA